MSGRSPLLPALLLGASLVAGCGALDVSDPTRIEDDDLNNGASADLLRLDAVQRLSAAAGDGALASALVADEFLTDPPPIFAGSGRLADAELLDRRSSEQYERRIAMFDGGPYARWGETRYAAAIAIPRLRAFAGEAVRAAYVGQMLAVRGYATLRLAEDFCPGFPLHDVVNFRPVYGSPLTTEAAFEAALVDLDAAVVAAADSARIRHFAQVARGRALLGLGRFADAAIAVMDVPTDYALDAEYGGFEPNPIFGRLRSGRPDPTHSVADREGGRGLDFVSAGDPRVSVRALGPARDGVTPLYHAAKYSSRESPIVLASGIEARLIAAEAALAGGGDWLGILNTLRSTAASPALPDLVDPGTAEARVDLLFRERAFWLFGTGHRLGDLRRLIGRYGRASETLFPTGPYRLGGVYETATSIPFPAALETPYNAAVTGCTAR